MLVIALAASTQTHFSFTSNTGNNMTVLVQATINPAIDGALLENGDEIGVFSPAGLCVGAKVWTLGVNCAITVWGDNDQTTLIDGIKTNEAPKYRIWDASLSREFSAFATYSSATPATADSTYAGNGIAVLLSLNGLSIPNAPVPVAPSNTAILAADSTKFVWQKPSPSVDKFTLEITKDSTWSSPNVFSDTTLTDTGMFYRGLANQTTYWWRVKAHNITGWGSFSIQRKFSIFIPVTSTLPRPVSFSFDVNKSTGSTVTYVLSSASDVSIRLITVQGKPVQTFRCALQSAGLHHFRMDLAALAKGIYLLTFDSGTFSASRSLVLLK
jgi:hypothetical protein